MLKKTVYFRSQQDLDAFNAIKNKAEWLNEMLSKAEKSFRAQNLSEQVKTIKAITSELNYEPLDD
jgi:hypothetical protein